MVDSQGAGIAETPTSAVADEAWPTEMPRSSRLRAVLRAASAATSALASAARVGRVALLGAMDVLVFASIVGMTVVAFTNVVLREFFASSLSWTLEVEQLGLTVLAFVGGARAFVGTDQMRFELVLSRLPARHRGFVEAFGQWSVVGAGALLVWQSRDVLGNLWLQRTPILFIHMTWYAVPMLVTGVVVALVALVHAVSHRPRDAVGSGVVVAAIAVAVALSHTHWGGLTPHQLLAISMGAFVVLLVSGVSIGVVLVAASFVYLYLAHSAPLIAVPLAMNNSMENLVLLALPMFIFAGFLMLEGGLAVPLARLVSGVTGRIPGGSLHALVLGTYIFSGLSGSKYADIAAVGSIMKSSVSDEDMESGEAAAALSASAAMGETIPPSIALIVLGSITSLSVSALFFAGLLPATLIAVALLVSIYLKFRRGRRAQAASAEKVGVLEVLRRTVVAAPALAVPVILIGGIVGGIATPTEVSSFAVVYAVVVSLVLYRKAGPRKLVRLTVDAAVMSGLLLFVVAAASAFSWTLASANVPQDIANGIRTMGGGSVTLFAVTIVAMITMGSFLEGLPALLIFGPLLLPAAELYGVNSLQYGIVIIITMGIGVFMPPIGIGSYLASGLFGTKIEATTRAFGFYFLILILALVLIAVFPPLTTEIPNLIGQ